MGGGIFDLLSIVMLECDVGNLFIVDDIACSVIYQIRLYIPVWWLCIESCTIAIETIECGPQRRYTRAAQITVKHVLVCYIIYKCN